jgi:hypothetical protein
MRAYLNGLSIVGQRTEDLRQITAWWQATTNAPVTLTAYGESTVPAIHAAALNAGAYAHLRLEGGIPSWQAVVEAPRPRDQIINTVHNALRYYDLDNLLAVLPAEKVTVNGAVVTAF